MPVPLNLRARHARESRENDQWKACYLKKKRLLRFFQVHGDVDELYDRDQKTNRSPQDTSLPGENDNPKTHEKCQLPTNHEDYPSGSVKERSHENSPPCSAKVPLLVPLSEAMALVSGVLMWMTHQNSYFDCWFYHKEKAADGFYVYPEFRYTLFTLSLTAVAHRRIVCWRPIAAYRVRFAQHLGMDSSNHSSLFRLVHRADSGREPYAVCQESGMLSGIKFRENDARLYRLRHHSRPGWNASSQPSQGSILGELFALRNQWRSEGKEIEWLFLNVLPRYLRLLDNKGCSFPS